MPHTWRRPHARGSVHSLRCSTARHRSPAPTCCPSSTCTRILFSRWKAFKCRGLYNCLYERRCEQHLPPLLGRAPSLSYAHLLPVQHLHTRRPAFKCRGPFECTSALASTCCKSSTCAHVARLSGVGECRIVYASTCTPVARLSGVGGYRFVDTSVERERESS